MGGSTFWGLVVKNGEPSEVEVDDGFCLKVAQVTLASGKKDATTSLYVTANKQKVLLCNLSSHADFHQFNDLSFMDEDSPVIFEIQGSGEVHLQGYMVSAVDDSDDERLAQEMEMESSEEEQQEEQEQKAEKGKPAANGSSARKDKLATAVVAQLKRQHADDDSEEDEDDSQREEEEEEGEEEEEEEEKQTKGKVPKKSEKSAPPAKKQKGEQDKKASGGQNVCSHCQKGFTSPAGLQQHTKDKHPA